MLQKCSICMMFTTDHDYHVLQQRPIVGSLTCTVALRYIPCVCQYCWRSSEKYLIRIGFVCWSLSTGAYFLVHKHVSKCVNKNLHAQSSHGYRFTYTPLKYFISGMFERRNLNFIEEIWWDNSNTVFDIMEITKRFVNIKTKNV